MKSNRDDKAFFNLTPTLNDVLLLQLDVLGLLRHRVVQRDVVGSLQHGAVNERRQVVGPRARVRVRGTGVTKYTPTLFESCVPKKVIV